MNLTFPRRIALLPVALCVASSFAVAMEPAPDSNLHTHAHTTKALTKPATAHTQHDADAASTTHDGDDHADMSGMNMDSMQGGSAPADARDPDYSDGIEFNSEHEMHMHGDARLAMLLIDRLEYVNARDANGASFETQAWYGNDYDKLWLKFEGDYSDSRIDDLRSEALWDHAVSAYWDSQLGVRHDSGVGPQRKWAAFGFQGLAPYWFELQATAYVGPGGRTAARFEAEYEILFSQRLILAPKLEFNAYGRNDRARGIGNGLSDASIGLRLRYEIQRRFAPYIGVSWVRQVGSSADYARADGHHLLDRQILVGVRIWL
ncbi:MAG TPA: copper resistance protein B [Rudaea sp.]|nr:copper resistance protein B [Rudaea sp.]